MLACLAEFLNFIFSQVFGCELRTACSLITLSLLEIELLISGVPILSFGVEGGVSDIISSNLIVSSFYVRSFDVSFEE